MHKLRDNKRWAAQVIPLWKCRHRCSRARTFSPLHNAQAGEDWTRCFTLDRKQFGVEEVMAWGLWHMVTFRVGTDVFLTCVGGKAGRLTSLGTRNEPWQVFCCIKHMGLKMSMTPYCFHSLSQTINNTGQLGQKRVLFNLTLTFGLIRIPLVIIRPWALRSCVFLNYDCSTE